MANILKNTFFKIIIISFLMNFVSSHSFAKNLGVVGEVFAIEEESFLNVIRHKLESKKKDSIFFNQDLIREKAKKKIDRPTPVRGVKNTQENRSYLYDPAVVIDKDIKSMDGKIIIKAGTRYNPLEHYSIIESLVFIDSDNEKHLNFALSQKNLRKIKIILVSGSRKKAAEVLDQEIYFDQLGLITQKFSIKHVPAIVTQEKQFLRISEILL